MDERPSDQVIGDGPEDGLERAGEPEAELGDGGRGIDPVCLP